MRAALLAIALTLGLAAPAGPGGAPPPGDAAASRPAGPPASGNVAPRLDRAASRPDGLLALAVLSPERALVADPRSGRTRERVVPGGTLCHGPLLAAGDRVVFAGAGVDRPEAWTAPIAAPAARARSLGPAEISVPSATPGRLWLGNRRGGSVELREVGPRGVVHARASTPVARWGTVQAQIGAEFLTTHGTGLVLGSERFRDAWLVAVHPERFAWCGDPCPRIGVWSGGRQSVLVPPRGVRPQLGPGGAFSPDGRRLALSVAVAGEPRFAVVDIARGDWSIVPRARPGTYSALAWSPSGRWLYLAARGARCSRRATGPGARSRSRSAPAEPSCRSRPRPRPRIDGRGPHPDAGERRHPYRAWTAAATADRFAP